MYYIYMIRCKDNSIYTGITTDLNRRMEEHKQKGIKCAKYTLTHTYEKLEKAWQVLNRKDACKLEYYLKTLKKKSKEELIQNVHTLEYFFRDILDCNIYMSYI